MKKGFVYLVGAGPGRADLITVRGAEILKAADCVLCDKLANSALLRFARKDAELLHVPKRTAEGGSTQNEINRLIVEKALEGKTVVRLKGGDPCIFGRASDELTVLNEAGIGFEIVPGVTAGVGMAAYAGIMLTDKEHSSQVMFVTGHEAPGRKDTAIDWDVLGKFHGTIVFYMGIGNLDFIAQRLIENGMPEDTPAALVANATFPTQRVVRASLGTIKLECERRKVQSPALVVIGSVADSDDRINWFMRKTLFGKSIVVTRDTAGNADFAGKIIDRGGNPVEFATIRIEPRTDSNEFLQALAKFSEYDWIIFTSGNGATTFFDALDGLGQDARAFGSAKVAAIGSKTAEKLAEFGIKADFVPDVFTGRELGRQLLGFANLYDKKVLLLRSAIASNELVEVLTEGGAKVDNVAVYTAAQVKSDTSSLVEALGEGTIDWVTFASPSSVDGFFGQVPIGTVNSSKAKVASIGPVTSGRLKELGVKVDVTAAEHTIDGLVDSIEQEELHNGLS
ncbi:MAG: uroporphyrinogen-III C-methyltransferase [Planctomycetota bacterium]|nr:uroporphyrinogen-III C-methyltransferase [Planctomycetota bacterium]